MSVKSVTCPYGLLASDDDARAKRMAIREKLKKNMPIVLTPDGKVSADDKVSAKTVVPGGKLASDDDARAKRMAIREKLKKNMPIVLTPDGKVSADDKVSAKTVVPGGKLAGHWYEDDPGLFAGEKIAMKKIFPDFKLDKLDDGRLYWEGELEPGVYEGKFHTKKKYHVMALYQNNHPNIQMGSSVFIYPIFPNMEELISEVGSPLSHVLCDSSGERYLCTTEAEYTKNGTVNTSAATVLLMALKWFTAYELVLTGELTVEEFNQHHGI